MNAAQCCPPQTHTLDDTEEAENDELPKRMEALEQRVFAGLARLPPPTHTLDGTDGAEGDVSPKRMDALEQRVTVGFARLEE